MKELNYEQLCTNLTPHDTDQNYHWNSTALRLRNQRRPIQHKFDFLGRMPCRSDTGTGNLVPVI